MNRDLVRAIIASAAVMALVACGAAANDYRPWDELARDSWIDYFDSNDPNLYPVNGGTGDIAASYPIAFTQAGGGNKARGMNAMKFIYAGDREGHLVTAEPRGRFDVWNSGDSNTYTHIFLVVAINAASLGEGFSCSLNLAGESPYVLGAEQFAYYDSPYGRPSGYYSQTDPNHDGLTYAFETGMVSVYALEGLGAGVEPFGQISVDYAFENLPGPAVFSVYALIGTDPFPTIYHTNKALFDNSDPTGSKNRISTFAVTIPADVNRDLRVDLADFAVMTESWLIGAGE